MIKKLPAFPEVFFVKRKNHIQIETNIFFTTTTATDFFICLGEMDIKAYIAGQLNEEQTKAALHTDTSSLIIAGAGS